MFHKIQFLLLLSFLFLASLPSAGAAEGLSSTSLEKIHTLDGKSLEMSGGNPQKIVLYFWATWCADCRESLHTFLPNLAKDNNLHLITVNTDKDIDRARHFVAKENITLPVFRDEEKNLIKELKVFSVPYWVVLTTPDSSGVRKILAAEAGSNKEKLLAALKN